jgi:hypothetical protein
MGVQRLTDVLVALRDQELLRPGCVAINRLDGGARDVPADLSRDALAGDAVASDAPTDGGVTD